MKKALDQTVRDLKRGVNKKVLKVPEIEQKILDATSNEPWGPHGSLLADIAQATRNYHEYQMIMNIIWKRINDTGKNWRHVYKALTVLDYLVAHGSEHIIDDIREHAYQISTLSDFQYIDSSGRDQGSNVRKKSQSLVSLVNNKERIQEVRQKALVNKEKYRSTLSTGGSYRPSSYSGTGGYGDRYDDDHYESRYGSRDGDQNRYGREREWGYGDDDNRYGRGSDSYNRDGDRYSRESDEQYGRESYREEEYRARGDDNRSYGSRNRSFDREKDRSNDEDGQYSSRSGGGRADEPSQDGRQVEHKVSEQSVGAPPGYEEATRDAQILSREESRGNGAATTRTSSFSAPRSSSSPETATQGQDNGAESVPAPTQNKEVDSFDEFDPRGSFSAASPAASSLEADLFGSVSASDPINLLALMPMTSTTSTPGVDLYPSPGSEADNFVAMSSVLTISSQPTENPFGDAPFKASQESIPAYQPSSALVSSFQTAGSSVDAGSLPTMTSVGETAASFNIGNALGDVTYTPSGPSGQQQTFPGAAFLDSEMPVTNAVADIPGIVPHTGPTTFNPTQAETPVTQTRAYIPGAAPSMGPTTFVSPHAGLHATPANFQSHPAFLSQSALSAPYAPQATSINLQPVQPVSPLTAQSFDLSLLSQPGSSAPFTSETSTTVPQTVKAQPAKNFEPKSAVWADTLSRGLVNLNISGAKINPHADIGIDFDSINRKEKREEKKSSAVPVTSSVTMGRAMGAGSGIGRAGAGGLGPPPNPMTGSGMGMGMGMGAAAGAGMSMGGYGGGMNQQPIGMGGMSMGMGTSMGMNIGMGQGMPIRPPAGMPPGGPATGVGYNPMMGMGYGSHQPYGGGFK